MAATVTPIRPDVVLPIEPSATPAKRTDTCPVCGISETWNVFLGAVDLTECRCGVMMHQECYWGRVASVDEWRVYLLWLNTSELGEAFSEPVTCPACRAAKEDT